MSQIDEIRALLDDLGDDATIDDVLFATRGYYSRDVMAAMYERALDAVQSGAVEGLTFTYGGVQA